MNISAEWIINKAKQKIYAISHAKVVVRNKSTVDADLTSLENRVGVIEEGIASGNIGGGGNVGGGANIWLGQALAVGELTIPTSGWEKNGELYQLDITNSTITANVVPVVVVVPASRTEAKECGFKDYCQTADGVLRLFSDSIPANAITASIALIGQKEENIPMADSDTAGLVKIGEGFAVDEDGKLNIDKDIVVTKDSIADDAEATQRLVNILNGTEENPSGM